MFEVAELKQKIAKQDYERELPEIRNGLLDLQQQLEKAGLAVIVLIAGVDGAGKGDLLTVLNEWFDPRYMQTHAFGEPSDEERERPRHWRYWMSLPPRGRVGLHVFAWYGPPMSDRIHGRIGDAELNAELLHINRLEKSLADDRTVIIKCWLHLSRKQQRKRLRELADNPETRWQVSELDRKHLKLYPEFVRIAERVLRQTSTPEAPWLIVNGYDAHYRRLVLGRHIAETINRRLECSNDLPGTAAARKLEKSAFPNLLDSLKLDRKIGKADYQQQLSELQGRLSRLTRSARQGKISGIFLFEGWDAAGKGGAIRRITAAMDARNFRVIPIAAPTDEEKAHHYLWRFWRHLPRDGRVTVYDRSWYGRVLVERVENLARPEEWMRAYSEIADFEEELTGHGILLLKFWLHISREEQLRRFKLRENTSYKRYKITEEDYRNREKWDAYQLAVNEMITRTSTDYAPWRLIEAEDKNHGRIKIIREICEAYDKNLRRRL
jgi:polyphosphate:AMP phosphotransferase